MFKLCCITNRLDNGGAGKSLIILLRDLTNHADVTLIARNKTLPKDYIKTNLKIKRIKTGFYPFHYLSGARDPFFINYLAWFCRSVYLPSTLKLIKQSSCNIILINGFQGIWYLPFLPYHCKKVLYARELLNYKHSDSKIAFQIIEKYTNHIICITEHEKNSLKNINVPISVIYNSYEGHFNSEKQPSHHRCQKDINIGIFGNINEIKGQYLVIDLVKNYLEDIKTNHIVFHLYGAPSTLTTRKGGKEELQQSVKDNNLEDYIKFPGWVEDVEKEIRSMDIILRPDTSGCPWGRDVIESMSNAKPIIAAGSSDIFIKDGINGYLFSPKNLNEMAEKIFKLTKNKDKRILLGKNAYKFAVEHFDSKKNNLKALKILKSLATDQQL